MSKLFISHSSQDDTFVRQLQQALGDMQQDVWIDSRELRGGDLLWPDIQRAISEASAYAVVVSPEALQSEWVADELDYALEVQRTRGEDAFPVVPLSLNGTKLGVLKKYFESEPLYIAVSSDAGGIDAALSAILVALRRRLPADLARHEQPKADALEELVLALTDLSFHEESGLRRASAHARLVYQPAAPRHREVTSERSWRFVAPLGPLEAEELRWYLEKYAIWPGEYFRERARKVERSLLEWGQLLYREALPVAHTSNVMQAWMRVGARADKRFSVHVDAQLEAGAPEDDVLAAREAATVLLGLPWELLHDGDSYLFEGARPTRVRRRLPNTRVLDVSVVDPPIRILLVTARPEDKACGYIDHRVTALPLVEAMESLGGLVELHILSPPTLSALRDELDRARRAGKPYHVLHFDGHGVYDRRVGLGGLCFEDPQDVSSLVGRRHQTVYTEQLGPLLRDHRIPLVVLEACQTAMSEAASESVASELLQRGVASVVAMTHSVLVETARRFVQSFYAALAEGRRVGDAMLSGQRALKDDAFRGRVFGAGELRLEDWFVPVLFQEKDDPQLFQTIPASQTQQDIQTALTTRLGDLPAAPATGFIGRSRDLLALERLLRRERYAVIRGQGGEGKTALAAEFARWMVRSHQVRRAAFVSVELHSTVTAVLDAIGRQLVPTYSVALFPDMERATLAVERALAEQDTLLVVDNMESILLPPFMQNQTPQSLSEDARHELNAILKLCARLKSKGNTRLVFTSREALPAPFDAERHRRELHRLDRADAVKFVERVLNTNALLERGTRPAVTGDPVDAPRESIEELVDAVQGHARTLALLAPSLRSIGVQGTQELLIQLMATMDHTFPGSREHSVFASVELSLRRMSPVNQDRARVLGVFLGQVDLNVLHFMTKWEFNELQSFAADLIATGLATQTGRSHLTLDPALCPYFRSQLSPSQCDALKARWIEAMRDFVEILRQERRRNTEMAASVTLLELPNLLALVEELERAGEPEALIAVTTSLYSLFQFLGKPALLTRLARIRDAASASLSSSWNHLLFEAERTKVQEQLEGGRVREALKRAHKLLQRARTAGEAAYPHADYDLAGACWLLARALKTADKAEEALSLLEEAQSRFEKAHRNYPPYGPNVMGSACISERADCLLILGRLNEAAAAHEEAIRRDQQRGDERDVASGELRLGTVRMRQHRYGEALAALQKALERFTRLQEPGAVAETWHNIGWVHAATGELEPAEDAYRRSLAISVGLGDLSGQASTINALALLRPTEDSARLLSQLADQFAEVRNSTSEGTVRRNLASCLRNLGRLDDARDQVVRAIGCHESVGQAGTPWTSWHLLAEIETTAGNPAAATKAKRKAIAAFLAYRRDGGENHDSDGRLAVDVMQHLLGGNPDQAGSILQQVADDPGAPPWILAFVRAMQAVVNGSRDPVLADGPELHYTSAAEVLLVLERLEQAGR